MPKTEDFSGSSRQKNQGGKKGKRAHLCEKHRKQAGGKGFILSKITSLKFLLKKFQKTVDSQDEVCYNSCIIHISDWNGIRFVLQTWSAVHLSGGLCARPRGSADIQAPFRRMCVDA